MYWAAVIHTRPNPLSSPSLSCRWRMWVRAPGWQTGRAKARDVMGQISWCLAWHLQGVAISKRQTIARTVRTVHTCSLAWPRGSSRVLFRSCFPRHKWLPGIQCPPPRTPTDGFWGGEGWKGALWYTKGKDRPEGL